LSSTIYESVDRQKLTDLLMEIGNGTMVLPDFQRSFVWEPSAIQGLLVSIANQYPAGSILRARDHKKPFGVRPFEGAPVASPHTFIVLDGQQRLTSLYQALYGVGDYRFFISLKLALSDPTLEGEDTIFFERAKKKGIEALEQEIALQAQNAVLPLSVLRKRKGGVLKWASDVRVLIGGEAGEKFDAFFQNIYEERLQHFEDYEFPTLTLSKDVGPASLCTIFETLNMTGVRLTVFELLTARVILEKLNLREMWDKAVKKYPIFEEFDVDPYAALQALALVTKGSLQKKVILELSKSDFDSSWPEVVSAMAKAFEILRDDCGVMTRTWLPTPSMIAPLAAIIVASSGVKGPLIGKRRAQIVRWLWCAMFNRRFEAAANTRAEKDFKEMKEWFVGGEPPETISQFRFDSELLYEVSTKSSPIYKSVMCLILSSEPKAIDFHRGSAITHDLVATKLVDDHHIFPKAYLEGTLGVSDKKLVNCVLNKTLIHRETNQIISDRAPSDYLGELDQDPKLDDVLRSHLIPTGADSSLRRDAFSEFLGKRASLIGKMIENVTTVG
jgi:hypothetical protein